MRRILLSVLLLTGGCTDVFMPTKGGEFSYKISEDGAPSTSNKNEFESLGEKMFWRTQRYRITGQTDNSRQYHLLAVKIQKTVGGKVVETINTEIFAIIDGVHDYECTHNYSIAISKADDSVDNPVCKIEPIAVFLPSSGAVKEQPTK